MRGLLFESRCKIYGEAGPATWTAATAALTKTHFWRLAATDAFLPMPARQTDRPRQIKKSPAARRTFPRSGCRRSWPPSVEMIVHADGSDVFPETPRVSGRKSRFYRYFRTCTRKGSDRGLAAEVNVQVFQLGRPIMREHPFGAGARGPADFALADTCGRHQRYLQLQQR